MSIFPRAERKTRTAKSAGRGYSLSAAFGPSRRQQFRALAAAVTKRAAVAGIVGLAALGTTPNVRADFLYTYTGRPYTIFFNPPDFAGTSPFQGRLVTGSIVIDDPTRAPFVAGEYLTIGKGFSLTDGITSYSGPTDVYGHIGYITLNSSYGVIAYEVYAITNGYPGAPSSGVLIDGDFHAPQGADGGVIYNADGTSFVANSSTPGTWRGPFAFGGPKSLGKQSPPKTPDTVASSPANPTPPAFPARSVAALIAAIRSTPPRATNSRPRRISRVRPTPALNLRATTTARTSPTIISMPP